MKAFVYVTALAPQEGETVAKFSIVTILIAGSKVGTGQSRADLSAARSIRRGVRAECLRRRIGAALRGSAADFAACITVPVNRPLWKNCPTWFLMAEQDRMIVHDTQRFMAERMHARVRSHPVDHAPIVIAPGLVVDIIREAIGEASSG